MKKFFLSLVVFAVLFNIGCQESMLNDPFDSSQNNNIDKTSPRTTKGTIELSGILVDPTVPTRDYYSISGKIGYECVWNYSLANVDPASAYNVVIALDIKAELTSSVKSSQIYTISGSTKDVLPAISGLSSNSFKKSFKVDGSKRGMELVCMFEVTTKGMKLTSKWLEFSKSFSADTK